MNRIAEQQLSRERKLWIKPRLSADVFYVVQGGIEKLDMSNGNSEPSLTDAAT
ncbi:hypothetical protein AIOL_001010 [Candidatus Rhodobacter oscarellae]|uniref:Uncharacterized protein n=1 Tax=Candidatus Rhodobacter oscarellae TaxID=1675527 RepID=A0A0J9GRE2_9RHOB|nr:hypothetical protein [Candidatus Rhodobacter lobularis]KMW56058.1 hypothetical protein AIOL_001010 [Candidatus Rhodobacter lobularis]